jgi:acetylornithine deacetylase/succinyl-diaminopimelate desuccinylase-like protein
MLKARLVDELRKRQADLFALCSRLVQIPSENPPGDTSVLASFINQCDPYVTPPDSRLVRLVLANAREINRRTVLPVVRLGYTDGRFFRRAGIPTVVYGPAVYNMGGPDEYIETADLLDVAVVHAGAAADMLAPFAA